MKKLKIIMTLAVIISAIGGLFAFSAQDKDPQTYTSNWYIFTGDPADINDVKDASQYVYNASVPGCNEAQLVCAVYAPGPSGSGQHPTGFNGTLLNQLQDAFDGNNQTTDIRMRDE